MKNTEDVELEARLQAALDGLLVAAGASRCTLRVDDAAKGWHVDFAIVEALRPGVESLLGVGGINQRAAATVGWLLKNRRNLVQPDLVNAPDPAPPTALLSTYGAKAQMLAPLFDDRDKLIGWISAHYIDGPRAFTLRDEAELSATRTRIAEFLQLPQQ
jgi:hypothetical protein